MSAHLQALRRHMARHGAAAIYTRLDNPVVTGSVRVANVSFQERPASEPDLVVQMSMRWVVLAEDLAAIGLARPYEGDRIQLTSPEIMLTVNRYGFRMANGVCIAYDLEATGR